MISRKHQKRNEIAELEKERDEGLSHYEKTVFILVFCLVFSLGVIGGWSGFLLLTENIQGGGPLGLLMEMLPLHLFL